ncbi:hypothetical protein RDI58_007128 [Solanum bulbocastanum]
MIGEYSP